jgi:hypothetical protein
MMRGIALLPQHADALLVVVEGAALAQNASLTIEWHLHTQATVTVAPDSHTATLTSTANETLGVQTTLAIVQGPRDCPGAAITVTEVVNGPDPQAPEWKDLGLRRVTITAKAQACKRLAVVMGAKASAWGVKLGVAPLVQWSKGGPLSSTDAWK